MSPAVAAGADNAPLEDLMVAMDVVDTLRHRDLIIDRELDAEGRRRRLLERLREIYTAQGIEVSDDALTAGVEALEQDRFKYSPTPRGFTTRLAKIYVSRRRWLKPFVGILAFALIIWLAWFVMVELPESRQQSALPASIETAHSAITAIAASDTTTARANSLLVQARLALGKDDYQKAEGVLVELQALRQVVETGYQIRIVSRPNELSGVWRVPDVNTDARNYYLIVEAVTSSGNVVPVRVRNEEDGRDQQVSKWGLRVSEDTFEAVAADKRDDGIIQGDIVGVKPIGQIEPEYRIPTSGATITDW